MKAVIAISLVGLFGAWLIAVSCLMLFRPERALHYLGRFASTNLINYTELGLRFLAGAAFVVAAPVSSLPGTFRIAGWFLVVTSVLLMLVPRQWHAAYAVYCSRALTTAQVRAFAPVSFLAGAALILAVLSA